MNRLISENDKFINYEIWIIYNGPRVRAGGGPGYAPHHRLNDVVVARPPLSLTSRALTRISLGNYTFDA